MRQPTRKLALGAATAAIGGVLLYACSTTGRQAPATNLAAGDAAARVYVAPGQHDEFYSFMSGGFSGQVTVYGLPSGRLLKTIPVFSQFPETGYGYSEETKPMPMTTHGFIPWDDSHHPELSQTDGEVNGHSLFINANNTPRIARILLAACSTGESAPAPQSPDSAPGGAATAGGEQTPDAGGSIITVEMLTDESGNNVFRPADFAAKPGDVVRFTLASGVHNVHFPADSNASATFPVAGDMLQGPGQSYDLKVTQAPGRYFYQCDPHALLGMVGWMTVTEK